MKKIVLTVAVVLGAFAFTSCDGKNAAAKINADKLEIATERDNASKGKLASISFDKTKYDFGTVNEGDIVETIFKVTNSGNVDLVITDARASCGCTVPVWPKGPIKPGESADIEVKFNTSGKPNRQSKSITLTTNTQKGNEVLQLTGSVTPKAR